MMKLWINLTCVWIMSFGFYKALGYTDYGQSIYQHVFPNYTMEVRPMKTANYTVIVYIKLTINTMKGINEITETMETVGFFRVSWQDHRLAWNPKDFGGVNEILVPAMKVWLPDLVIYNSDSSFYDYSYRRDFMVRLNSSGYILWSYGGVLSTDCDMDMSKYPFDSQSCDIVVETWRYGKEEVELEFTEGGLHVNETAYTSGAWLFVESSFERFLKYNNTYRRLVFNLVWKRKPQYFYANIITPIVLLTFVAMGVFWLPVESGDKISLAITILLAMSVFQIVIMDNTPVTDVVPQITKCVLLVICISTMSLLASMYITYINGHATKRPPKIMRLIFFKYVAKMLCMTDENHTFMNEYKEVNGEVKTNVETSCNLNIQNHNTEKDDDRNHGDMKKILEKLDQIVAHIDTGNDSEAIKEEWAFIGRVVDRMLFWITLVILIIFVILIFMS